MRYTRSASALQSALSNSPCQFDYKLFETYKVASKLPPDIFETMCADSLQQKVSAFDAQDSGETPAVPEEQVQIANALSGKDI